MRFIIHLLLFCKLILADDEVFAPREFDSVIVSKFIADVTSKASFDNFHDSMFRALTFVPSDFVLDPQHSSEGGNYAKINFLSVERLNFDTPGLIFTTGSLTKWNGSEISRRHGFANASEDPRIITVGNKAIVSFTVFTGGTDSHDSRFFQRWMAVSYFHDFNPVILKIPGLHTTQNFVEKNWAPFSRKNELLFVYSFDPLVVLSCQPDNPDCEIVFIDDGVSIPVDTRTSHLRGGSNFVPVSDSDDRYYVGGCHTFFNWKVNYHFYVIVVLDTVDWKIIHVSKPVRFNYEGQRVGWGSHIQLGRVGNTLMDMYVNFQNRKLYIQDPVSLMRVANNTFLTTVNVRDCISLLYELVIPLDEIILEYGNEPRKPIGHWNQRAYEMSDWLGDYIEEAMRKGHNLAGVRESHTSDGREIPSWRSSHC